MFKALLKTMPSLSGNMKLSCFVDDYKRHNKTYSCSIKTAKLLPIAHSLFDKNIYVNLKNNSYEYDVKHFYKNYFDVFYKSYYSYSKLNIPIIDFTNNISDCNEDFNFGCKRVSFIKYDNQLAFFAPIYIESLDDIKNKYFKITCTFNKINKLTKELIIDIYDNIAENEQDNIWTHNGENYLSDYLIRYAEKIDDKVIYMSNTYKNMYYGIDLLHGGFIHVEDNISKNLYKKYYTINDFDAIINFGYKRNAMIMKQIIPLSFYFNPQNLLTGYEKSIYKDAEIKVTGAWYTKTVSGKISSNDIEEKFYNFVDNYSFYNESNYQLSTFNKFNIVNNTNNIMNMSYPAFKEASSENYRFINAIIKTYNRWKLKYSDDNYPYIINNNFAFSANQGSLYSYKEFPLLYKTQNAICKFKGENYNMFFDMEDIYDQYGKLLNIKSEYYDLFNKNYISNFYNLLVKHNDNDTIEYVNEYDNIFTIDDYWVNIHNDNKLYYKGILYDFNKLYSQYTDMPKIDKFSIFVNPEMKASISNTEYNYTYNSVKYTLNDNVILNELSDSNNAIDNIVNKIYKHDFIENNLSYITNNNVVYNDRSCAIQDKSGNYIDINGYYISKGEIDKLHYNKDLYVDANEILMYSNLFCHTYNQNIYDKIYNNSLNIITGYKIIDIKYKNNIISEIYSEILKLYPYKQYQFNNDNLIYSEHKFLQNDDIYWAYDMLYYSIYPNKTKYKLLENPELLFTLPFDNKITLYFKTNFITLDDFNTIYTDYDKTSTLENIDEQNTENILINTFNTLINKINKYYVTNTLYDKMYKKAYSDLCFVRLNEKDNHYGKYTLYDLNDESNIDNDNCLINFKENVLFVDTYNLTNFYNTFFKLDYEQLHFYKVKDCYCNFLNLDHIHKYFERLYNNENLTDFKSQNDIKKTIYVKIHLLNNVIVDSNNANININFINTTTKYIPLSDFFFGKNLSLYELLDFISYDDNGFFFFTYNYFATFKNELTNPGDDCILSKYPIKNFELCFKKTMAVVNTQLYNLIMQLNSHNLFKDLYLYKVYDNTDYKFEYVMNNIKLNKLSNLLEFDGTNNDLDIFDVDNVELYPYFNSIYNEEKNKTKIYNDTFLNNIIKCENADLYKYNVYNIDYLIYYPKSKYHGEDGLCPYRYSLYEKYNNYIVNSYTFAYEYMHDMKYLDNYNDYNNMITYTWGNTTYGFYIIHSEFDNTTNTLNLISENYNKINTVSYINDINCDIILANQYTYLTQYYHNLIPYINNSNIVKDLLNNVSIIITPNKYNLQNIYQQLPNINLNNEITSYNIIVKGKTNLQLLRYFDNIVPYILESDNVTSYYLYYKNTNKYVENDLYNKQFAYIMYQKSINIYDEKNIQYFNNTLNQNPELSYLNLEILKYTPIEYKNYNNNKYYNLETNIEIELNSNNSNNKNLFTQTEIHNIENDKFKIYELFKEHLLNENNMLSENEILFLYKKYEVNFSHTIRSFHKNENNERDYDLYSLIIKYKLL